MQCRFSVLDKTHEPAASKTVETTSHYSKDSWSMRTSSASGLLERRGRRGELAADARRCRERKKPKLELRSAGSVTGTVHRPQRFTQTPFVVSRLSVSLIVVFRQCFSRRDAFLLLHSQTWVVKSTRSLRSQRPCSPCSSVPDSPNLICLAKN